MRGCRPITDDEIKALSSELSLRDYTIVLLGVTTGFRIAEMLSLSVGDVIDVDGKVLDEIKVQRRNTKGKDSGAIVSLHTEIKEVLGGYLKSKKFASKEEPLFSSVHGRLDDSVFRKKLKKAVLRAGLKTSHLVSTHSLRKTYAKKFFEACGNDIYLTQQALRHSHIGITVRYLQEDRELVSKITKSLKFFNKTKE